MPTRCARRVGTRLGAGFTLTQLGQRLDGALMKDLESLDAAFVIDTFLLLLIGIGPKIALVPFLDMTVDMPEATKRRIVRKMLTTAATVAALLLVIAVAMVLGHQSGRGQLHRSARCRCRCARRGARVRRRRLPLGGAGQQQVGREPDAGHREGIRFPAGRARGAAGAQRTVRRRCDPLGYRPLSTEPS